MSFNPANKVTPNSTSIGQLFTSNYLEVPDNQREYRWGIEQLEKIWDDLLTTIASENSSTTSDRNGHFLGAIVVIGEMQSHDKNRWRIIDGQQRLTTITILAASLLEFSRDIKDEKLKRRLQHILRDCFSAPLSDDAPRIILNREDKFYRESLIGCETIKQRQEYWKQEYNEKSEVQRNIRFAFEYFRKKISAYIEENNSEPDDSIRDLIETLTVSFYVLSVKTDNLLMAYKLFETLNDRGLKLSQADLIKNSLLEYAQISGATAVKKVTELWANTIDNYEDQPRDWLELPQIIQFSYAHRHELVKKEDIFAKVSQAIKDDRVSALEFAGEFHKDSVNWRGFLLREIPHWDEELTEHQIAITDPLWKSHCAPFIMAIVDKFSQDINSLKILMRLTENYLLRQGLIAKDSVSSLQEFFTNAARLARSTNEMQSISDFFQKRSPDEIFKEKFSLASISNSRQGTYILRKIENHIRKIEGKQQLTEQHSLEYILPKKPGNTWGNIAASDSFKANLDRIGNLIIIESKISQHLKNNNDFKYKLENDFALDYKNSENETVQDFINKKQNWIKHKEWNFSFINERQHILANKYAANIWPLSI